jgi:alpha/beta superfamily hydrolase
VPLAAADQRLKQLLVPEHDRFCPPAAVAAATATWTACSTEVVPMADHFLHGAVQHIVERVAHLLTESP